jgi:hypothetical protein
MITKLRRWRYTVQDTDTRGNVRTYLRLPGRPKVRLREEPGTDAFEAEYRAALHAPPKAAAVPIGAVAPGSIDALCVAYYASAAFKGMNLRAQRVRRGILDRFRMDHGTKSAARLDAPSQGPGWQDRGSDPKLGGRRFAARRGRSPKLDTSRNPAASSDEGGLRLSGRQ